MILDFFLRKRKRNKTKCCLYSHTHKKEIAILVGFAHPVPAYTF